MAHVILKESRQRVRELIKDKAYISENEAILIQEKDGVNFPVLFRPHPEGVIVKMDNFPMFVDEDTVEDILIETVNQLSIEAQFYNFRKSRLKKSE